MTEPPPGPTSEPAEALLRAEPDRPDGWAFFLPELKQFGWERGALLSLGLASIGIAGLLSWAWLVLPGVAMVLGLAARLPGDRLHVRVGSQGLRIGWTRIPASEIRSVSWQYADRYRNLADLVVFTADGPQHVARILLRDRALHWDEAHLDALVTLIETLGEHNAHRRGTAEAIPVSLKERAGWAGRERER